ncbi:MAG: glycosyltransferase family 4 protein [Candidatus Krumholzibacteriota bacterium]|nr:glycosyltransferase family 4 protein [Candidatus Krumholzibacteriota bacterium]
MTRPLHIWFVARSLPVHFNGGLERMTDLTARGLAGRGHRLDVVTTSLPAGAEPDLPPGTRLHALPAPPGRHSREFRRELPAWAAAQDERPDLLLSISSAAAPLLSTAPWSELPSVLQFHGSFWTGAQSKLAVGDPRWPYNVWQHLDFEREALRGADRLVSVGPALTAALSRFPLRLVDPARVVEIPNALDEGELAAASALDREALRRELGIAPGGKLALSACRLQRQKGVQGLLRAWAGLEDREGRQLLVAGTGPQEASLRRWAEERRLADVRFLGGLPHGEVLRLLRAADLLVQAGRGREGLPLAILEALALGVPVLKSRHILVPGEDAEPGIVSVDPRRIESLREGLVRALALPAPDADVARRSRDRYATSTMLDDYEALFAELLAPGGEHPHPRVPHCVG